MNLDSMYESWHLKTQDIGAEGMRVTIGEIKVQEVGQGERKPVLYFREPIKPLILNIYNGETLRATFGAETDNWIGRQLEVFAADALHNGQPVKAMRVRVVQTDPAATPKPEAP